MKKDPIALLLKLQEQFEKYGAVKLKCCPEWKPAFSFRYTDKGITTRIQKVHKLKKGKVSYFLVMDPIIFIHSLK
jgi:hypothetical protein